MRVVVAACSAPASSLDLKQTGVGLAVAVLLNATVGRAALLPAWMKLLGEWSWYLPGWLAWLPGAEPRAITPADYRLPVPLEVPAARLDRLA
jgi:uncharacterized membrane protein YdfJ with MMPL/SSD domain